MLQFKEVTISVESLKETPVSPEVLHILGSVRPEWEAGNIRGKLFTGGVMNVMYGYYEEGKFDEDVVLFRIEGEANDLMVDKERELLYMQAFKMAGCGPPVYATFKNGLVYGYIHGETLDLDTVKDPQIARLIAKEMCRLHAACPEGRKPTPEWKEYCFLLLDLSPDGFPENPEKHKRYTKLIKPKDVLRKEFELLWAHLDALKSPLKLCHNDTLNLNIVYNKQEGTIRFIDFETAMFSNVHYELACHFCEYAGSVNMDFTRYPDKPYQLNWLRYYLQCEAEQNGGSASDVSDRDVEECYIKTNKFSLLAHFCCALWALAQSKYSKLDFDFLGYAALRLNRYYETRDEWFALDVPN